MSVGGLFSKTFFKVTVYDKDWAASTPRSRFQVKTGDGAGFGTDTNRCFEASSGIFLVFLIQSGCLDLRWVFDKDEKKSFGHSMIKMS